MIVKIKEFLYGNEEKLKDILEALEFEKIKKVKDSFKFSWADGGNSSGIANTLNIETLKFKSFSKNKSGDILSLVSLKKSIGLGEAINWLCDFLNLEKNYSHSKKEVELPFGGFFMQFEKVQNMFYPYETYDESIVKKYMDNGLSLYWIKQGISALTQEKFSIGYDIISGRITIPWKTMTGEVLGIQGRLDKENCEDWEFRYMPIINFYKSNSLYGLYENYKDIQELGEVVIVESEKSVLLAREMGYTNVIAVGCHNLAPYQIKLVRSLISNVILAYDEDIPLQECIEQGKELIIDNPFFSNQVCILDMSGLEKKSCIFDLNKEVVDEAFKNRLIYLN